MNTNDILPGRPLHFFPLYHYHLCSHNLKLAPFTFKVSYLYTLLTLSDTL